MVKENGNKFLFRDAQRILLLPLLIGGGGLGLYGSNVLAAKYDALEKRINRIEARAENRLSNIERKIDKLLERRRR